MDKQANDSDFGEVFDVTLDRALVGLGAAAGLDIVDKLSKYGPDHPDVKKALKKYGGILPKLREVAQAAGKNPDSLLEQIANNAIDLGIEKPVERVGLEAEASINKYDSDYQPTGKKIFTGNMIGTFDVPSKQRSAAVKYIKQNISRLEGYAERKVSNYAIEDVQEAREIIYELLREGKFLKDRNNNSLRRNYEGSPYAISNYVGSIVAGVDAPKHIRNILRNGEDHEIRQYFEELSKGKYRVKESKIEEAKPAVIRELDRAGILGPTQRKNFSNYLVRGGSGESSLEDYTHTPPPTPRNS